MTDPTAVEDQPTGQKEPWPWCYVTEACEILGKSMITLQRWRSSGYGPAWSKNGNRVVYRRSDLYDWMLGRAD
jgi:predicted site-specific integrase-resolvase